MRARPGVVRRALVSCVLFAFILFSSVNATSSLVSVSGNDGLSAEKKSEKEKAQDKQQEEKCSIVKQIHANTVKSKSYGQYRSLINALSTRNKCHEYSNSGKKVCTKDAQFSECCGDSYEESLQKFISEKECLMSILAKGSIIDPLVSDNGKFVAAIRRLEKASKDARPTVASVYRDEMKLLKDMQAAVKKFLVAVKGPKYKIALEAVRHWCADVMCAACKPQFSESSSSAGGTVLLKVSDKPYKDAKGKITTGLQGSLKELGHFVKLFTQKDGLLERALELKSRHFVAFLDVVASELSGTTIKKVDNVVISAEKASKASEFVKEKAPEDSTGSDAASPAASMLQKIAAKLSAAGSPISHLQTAVASHFAQSSVSQQQQQPPSLLSSEGGAPLQQQQQQWSAGAAMMMYPPPQAGYAAGGVWQQQQQQQPPQAAGFPPPQMMQVPVGYQGPVNAGGLYAAPVPMPPAGAPGPPVSSLLI
eukprot:GHVU01032939.1.p1 GENE.GHVU01032939.1~~GHVU01032939.1.p1  ORF type:complete len:479 (+),score=89.64 GHVU01032939.1:104-1540(+)